MEYFAGLDISMNETHICVVAGSWRSPRAWGLSSAMQAPWQFLFGFGGLAGLGFGMAATHADAAMALASAAI
jgi:hypothetical protein